MEKQEIHKAYKFRVYPNKDQEVFIRKSCGSCRFVYNYFLAEKTKYYNEHKNDKKKGLIFWENIQNFDNIDEYLDSYKKQTEINKEEAYAKQNYFVSKILKEKNAQIRNSIYFFGLSITLGIISLIIFKIIS